MLMVVNWFVVMLSAEGIGFGLVDDIPLRWRFNSVFFQQSVFYMRLKMILVGFKVFLAYKNSFIIEPFSEICIHNSVFRYNCNKFVPPTRFKIWIIRWYFEHAYAFLFRPTQNMATLNWEVNSRYSIYQKQFLAEVYAETYLSKKKKKNSRSMHYI